MLYVFSNLSNRYGSFKICAHKTIDYNIYTQTWQLPHFMLFLKSFLILSAYSVINKHPYFQKFAFYFFKCSVDVSSFYHFKIHYLQKFDKYSNSFTYSLLCFSISYLSLLKFVFSVWLETIFSSFVWLYITQFK